MAIPFGELAKKIEGELYFEESQRDNAMRLVYSTDASVYQEKPIAVSLPKTVEDLKALIRFANDNHVTLVPRAAGTSLAGQVVGNGIVVDISKYFTSVLEVNEQEKWVRVQPGVIRDDLNAVLRPTGLMFGPETSTSNRAMIGGMIGNNSSGLHSIIWGDTRANLLEVNALLSDGSELVFKDLTYEEYQDKCKLRSLEGEIYRSLQKMMQEDNNQKAIREGFPKASVKRRNTGYALDAILHMFTSANVINICQLIAGSEGTLCFITEAKLRLLDLPPTEKGVVAVHTNTINEALRANLVALKHHCRASELVDDIILAFTKTNIDQSKNRFFVQGEPRAILMVEFFDTTQAGLLAKANALIHQLQQEGLGYAWPLLLGNDSLRAWDLRKAGLGLLRNEPGEAQPVNLIEDCAVDVEDLPNYIAEVEALLQKYQVKYSMYAHAGAGELHVEPMLNLKTTAGKHLFRTILHQTAAIVKKYNGSLSGEHGDGRLRGEFISFIMGEKNFALFHQVKQLFDPKGIFNKGKIVDTPKMNDFLRYEQDKPRKHIETTFSFSSQESILHLAEKCSGSGDCRKTQVTGGVMCPSYMATRSERDTTRARANMLRHFYTNIETQKSGALYAEVLDVLDLCISCKGCKSECPSSVDITKMKAEFLQQYYDRKGVPFRSKLVANFSKQMKLAAIAPWAYNSVFGTPALRRVANKSVGFHPDRTMPLLAKTTLLKWWERRRNKMTDDSKKMTAKTPSSLVNIQPSSKVYFFCDEFTNYNDVEIGQKLILLLEELGYEVIIPKHVESGRTYLSKGLVREAKKIAITNVNLLKDIINDNIPIIGIEPSAILTLRDEYLDLVSEAQKEDAKRIAKNTFLFDEWFAREMLRGNITKEAFTTEAKQMLLHGHCHQKVLSSTQYTMKCLSLPQNYEVNEIPSGCCGMAGSFGYEEEHYDVSMKIGELVLFPAVRSQPQAVIAATGTSCRHQIKDGTQRIAKHPVEILYEALK
ncbi:FAD-binding and (Fe-S)-binding domain-containing protein [Segetibacter sp.]|uniref:FAD-binding and (Fe-S)-binding domain-containing protein n=1 Tax=Segetibacter sp. TaxID=2231182 RepID=UPI00260FD770|nr:FAD-binding and (Fe-S)-binding domain-containing protein [Segetibacter sp.]MCW3079028.1 linked oxidase domain protein [Segetibacter sp.]